MSAVDPAVSGTGKPYPNVPGNVGPSTPLPNSPPPPPNIPGITPTPAILGPTQGTPGLIGLARLDQEFGLRGLRSATPQADQWVLSIPLDANDQEYNWELQHMKADAQRRQSLRQQFPNTTPDEESAIEAGHTPNPRSVDGLDPNERKALADANAAKQHQTDVANARVANENATRGKPVGSMGPAVVDSHGNKIDGPGYPSTGPGNQSGALAGTPGGTDTSQRVLNGGYVWLGSGTNQESPPPSVDAKGNPVKNPGVPVGGNLLHSQDVFMSVDDAKASIYGMSTDQIKVIQKAYHLNASGIVDAKTLALWGEAVDASAGYTKAGKHMSPIDVLTVMAKSNKGAGRGGGGGGGGGAAKFKLSDVQALLTSITQKELGRDPTQAEVNAFFHYFDGLAGSDTASPTQIATDWVRQHQGGEQGSYGAATNYYQAMLSVLGPSAAGGAR